MLEEGIKWLFDQVDVTSEGSNDICEFRKDRIYCLEL